jgi:hypothetical protein
LGYKDGVRSRANAVLLLSAIALAGCAGDERSTWDGPPDPSSDGSVAVDGFVEFTDDVDDTWEGSPAAAGAEFLRLDEREVARTTIAETRQAEGAGPATVVVTLDGLFDDSIRAERWTLTFSPQGDTFMLDEARWAQRCQPDRGHQDFSPERCV